MNGKTYRGESFSELLERATAELGQEAVVLSSRRVPGTGHHEIVVTVPDASSSPSLLPIDGGERKLLLGTSGGRLRARLSEEPGLSEPAMVPPDAGGVPSTPAPALQALGGRGATDPVAQRLMAAGVQAELARRLVAEASADGDGSEDAVRQRLARLLGQGRGGSAESSVVVLAGPPGCGKTTLAAKLAAHHRFRLGTQPALVTLDTQRVGAIDQLRTFAELLGVPFAVARDAAELAALLAVHARSRPVLVDTPGLVLSKDEDRRQLQTWLGQVPEQSLLFVSAASTSRDLLAANLARLAGLSLGALAFTRLDEREDLGLMASACALVERPIRYTSNGPNVPGDLRVPVPAVLARRILPQQAEAAPPSVQVRQPTMEVAYGASS